MAAAASFALRAAPSSDLMPNAEFTQILPPVKARKADINMEMLLHG